MMMRASINVLDLLQSGMMSSSMVQFMASYTQVQETNLGLSSTALLAWRAAFAAGVAVGGLGLIYASNRMRGEREVGR